MRKISSLFVLGVQNFNNHNFYAAHENFEDIWSNYQIKDRLYLQGLIQLSVSYFHISNDNLNGALSLAKKAIEKIKKYDSFFLKDLNSCTIKIVNINEILSAAYCSYDNLLSIKKVSEFNWGTPPKIQIKLIR